PPSTLFPYTTLFRSLLEARLDPGLQVVRELSLPGDRIENGALPLLELGEIRPAVGELPELDLVHLARPLLAVSGDERHRRSIREEIERVAYLERLDRELRGENPGNVDHGSEAQKFYRISSGRAEAFCRRAGGGPRVP